MLRITCENANNIMQPSARRENDFSTVSHDMTNHKQSKTEIHSRANSNNQTLTFNKEGQQSKELASIESVSQHSIPASEPKDY